MDKIGKIKSDINKVQIVMKDNIEKVLKRGENIDSLVMKTEELEGESRSFSMNTKKLKKKMWWKNRKMCCTITIILIVLGMVGIFLLMWFLGAFKRRSGKRDLQVDLDSAVGNVYKNLNSVISALAHHRSSNK